MTPVRPTRPFFVALCAGVIATGWTALGRQGGPPLAPLVLPAGFQADVFAEKVENARSMALGPQGTVFVGSQYVGKVHAVVDADGDHKADRVVVIASGLDQPNGVAIRNGALYVATASRLLRFDDIEKHLDAPPTPVTLRDDLPNPKTGHTWKFIAFGPDDMLYMSVGAPCNVCLSPPMVSAIVRMKPDGSGMESFAVGVRNSVGFDWHPVTRELWFTDNGRDMLGDDVPDDEQYNGSEQQSPPVSQPPAGGKPSGPVQQRIAPGLATLTDDVLFGDVWLRPDLSPRDRSLVTISVLIATGKPAQLAGHLGRALSNGVQPSEASGVLAHLAIYCGWPSAVSALEIYEQVYTARKVDTGALRAISPRLPAPGSDAVRAKTVTEELGAVAPKFVQLTNDVVFDDLWRRSDLSVRDRSLVTIAALAAMGDDDQLNLYLRRAIESGLTRAQITEALTHLGFYAGWPKATKAITAITTSLGK